VKGAVSRLKQLVEFEPKVMAAISAVAGFTGFYASLRITSLMEARGFPSALNIPVTVAVVFLLYLAYSLVVEKLL
jgi:hypothetical protein